MVVAVPLGGISKIKIISFLARQSNYHSLLANHLDICPCDVLYYILFASINVNLEKCKKSK
jgi:hypothetical protein